MAVLGHFRALYGFTAEFCDGVLNDTFIRVIQKLHARESDILLDQSKFERYFAISVVNKMRDCVRSGKGVGDDYSFSPNEDYDGGSPVSERIVADVNPEIVDFCGRMCYHKVGSKRIVSKALSMYGNGFYRTLAAIKLARGVVRFGRSETLEGDKMKQNISRTEYEYFRHLCGTGNKSEMEDFLTANPDKLGKMWLKRLSQWISTDGIIVDDPSDCFGVANSESATQCISICSVSGECKAAMALFVEREAEAAKKALLGKPVVKRNVDGLEPWVFFQGDHLPKDITVFERSRVGLKIADSLYYRGHDAAGWHLCYWAFMGRQPEWVETVMVVDKKIRSIHFIVPDIKEFLAIYRVWLEKKEAEETKPRKEEKW